MNKNLKYHLLNISLGSIFVVSIAFLFITFVSLVAIVFAPQDEKEISCTNDMVDCITFCAEEHQTIISLKKFRCGTECSFKMIKCNYKSFFK